MTISGWLLVELMVKVTVALGAVYLITRFMRRAPAAHRHLVWTVGLTVALTLPVAGHVLPWRMEILPAPVEEVRSDDLPGLTGEGTAAGTEAEDRGDAASADEGEALASDAGYGPDGDRAGLEGASGLLGSVDWANALTTIWWGGTLLALLALGRSVLVLRRIRANALPLSLHSLRSLSRRLRDELAHQNISVLRTPGIGVPLATGVSNPTILLPAEADDWSAERLEVVLQHEIAHIRRRDVLTHLAARACSAVYWFHPLVHIGSRHLRSESEQACDDAVLRAGASPSAYAAHLLELAGKGQGTPTPAAALCMARSSEFEGRLLAILRSDRKYAGLSRRTVSVVGALSVAGLAALAAVGAGPTGSAEGAAMDEATAAVLEDAARGAPEDMTGVLMDLLDDRDSRVRGTAARSLGERRAVEAVPALEAMLSDRNREVRRRAVIALGEIEDTTALPAIAELARSERSEWVQEAAIWAVGEMETLAAVEVLADIISNTWDDDIIEASLEALGETGRDEAVPILADFLDHKDRDYRMRAINALADIGSPDAQAILVQAMRSDDGRIRSMAAAAVGNN